MFRFVFLPPTARCTIIALVASISVFSSVQAQKSEDTGFSKRDSVVIAVPTALMNVHLSTGIFATYKYDLDARSNGGVIEVLDSATGTWRSDWRSAGFPPSGRYDIHKIIKVTRIGTKQKMWEITVNTSGTQDFRIFVPVEQPEVARALIAPVAAADSVLQLSYAAIDSVTFVGPLATFSPAERTALLKFAHITANGTTLGSEDFKGLTYMTISLPLYGSTWNDLQVTRSKRIGALIEEQLALLKLFAKIAMPHDAIGGLMLRQDVRHGTAPYYTDATTEHVMAYFPLKAILSFADFDITSQELVNQSIILVDDNRVEVDLSSQ